MKSPVVTVCGTDAVRPLTFPSLPPSLPFFLPRLPPLLFPIGVAASGGENFSKATGIFPHGAAQIHQEGRPRAFYATAVLLPLLPPFSSPLSHLLFFFRAWILVASFYGAIDRAPFFCRLRSLFAVLHISLSSSSPTLPPSSIPSCRANPCCYLFRRNWAWKRMIKRPC